MKDETLSREEIETLLGMNAAGSREGGPAAPAEVPLLSRPLEPLYSEHPQTVALFLVALRPEDAAALLTGLDYAEQADIAQRIARFEPTETAAVKAPAIVETLSAAVKEAAGIDVVADAAGSFSAMPGALLLASILEHCPYGTRRRVLLELADRDREAAWGLRCHVFVFDDLYSLSDGSAGKIFSAAGREDLARAMRGAGTELREKIYRVLPRERSLELKELLDWGGAVATRVVEEAQERIVEIAKDLARQGLIDPAAEFRHRDANGLRD
ncbi:MAG TPA: hypothetical protein ENN21_03845 [Spirochaetes bacterium]|nr:hypothetical protein [Spirochaetota bacterium]